MQARKSTLLYTAASLDSEGIQSKHHQHNCVPHGRSLTTQPCNCISLPILLPILKLPDSKEQPSHKHSLKGHRVFLTLSSSAFDCQIIMLKFSLTARIYFLMMVILITIMKIYISKAWSNTLDFKIISCLEVV